MQALVNNSTGWSIDSGLSIDSRLDQLNVAHGVTTRALGNMKEPSNRSAALAKAGLKGQPLVLQQIHGKLVHEARACDEPLKGDGWISTKKGQVIGVYAADCLPIFIWDEDLKAVGVFHAGWRGLAAGMPKSAVEAFASQGFAAKKLFASVGAHVGACCYKVSPDVAEQFHPQARAFDGDTIRLDLGAEAELQLKEVGVRSDRIIVSNECTSCLKDDFFSFRRDKQDQRMLAFIALP